MWSPAGSQAVDLRICSSGLESPGPAEAAALGLWVGQLASAPGEHPPEVSGVGCQPGFEV